MRFLNLRHRHQSRGHFEHVTLVISARGRPQENRILNFGKFVNNTPLAVVFSTPFSAFGNVVNTILTVLYILLFTFFYKTCIEWSHVAIALKNSVLNNSDNLFHVGHAMLVSAFSSGQNAYELCVLLQKRPRRTTDGQKVKYYFKNYRFLSTEIYRNGHNGVLLCSDVQSFIRKSQLQVLCISKR